MNLERRVDALEERVAGRAGEGCEACTWPGGYEVILAAYGAEVRPDDEWPPGGEDGNRLNRVCPECRRPHQAIIVRWPD